jgi:hypothetical protein
MRPRGFEAEQYGKHLADRARRAREKGQVHEDRFPVQAASIGAFTMRDSSIFDDISGTTVLGVDDVLETTTT